MRLFNKKLLRIIYTLLLAMLLTGAALAAEPEADLRVYPVEESGGVPENPTAAASTVRQAMTSGDMTTGDAAIELIQKYEGFYAYPYEDSQWTAIGYGSRYSDAVAKFGSGCEPITEEQAVVLLRDELVQIEEVLNSFMHSNNIVLNQNQFDALVSFTYNVGTGWTTYKNDDGTWCKLKVMLLDDPSTWTEERAQEAFGTWVRSNGQVLQGLVRRRAEEATLFCTPCTVSGFSDVSANAWYAASVTAACEQGFMQGMGDGTFAPEAPMTRAQMVMALANFAGVDLSRYGTVRYSDVPAGQWYTAAVDWATQMGLINGMGDGTFCPNDPIRREHVCNILGRYLHSRNVAPGPSVAPFQDDGQIQDSARDNVYYCASLGLIDGVGDGYFAPAELATRAQMAKILVCMDQLFG